ASFFKELLEIIHGHHSRFVAQLDMLHPTDLPRPYNPFTPFDRWNISKTRKSNVQIQREGVGSW
ncbi:MAG: hypothetical protein ACPF9S_06350, partial [Candidatus Poseidoniaceae archaeon]